MKKAVQDVEPVGEVGGGRGKKGRRGRPPMYEGLFQSIQEHFGAGVWVRAVSFTDPNSARVALKKVRDGERPVPGGVEVWDLECCIEDVEVEGGGAVRGSALYARWVPGKQEVPEW